MLVRLVCAVVVVLAGPVIGLAQSTVDPAEAISRGERWLIADMQKWREDHNCGACHHAPLALFVLGHDIAARNDRGEFLRDLARWASTPEARLVPNDDAAEKPKLSPAAVYLALGVNALPASNIDLKPLQEKLFKHVRLAQNDDGSWTGPVGRWPVLAPPVEMTLLTLIASDSLRANNLELAESLERAAAWVKAQPVGESHQELALRIWLSALRNEPDALTPLIARMKSLQAADGGWKQAADEPTDAFATGQGLVALRRAGVSKDDAVVQRGLKFLVQTQRPDGSWPITSRPHPENHSRAGNLNPITYAGTAWAIAALAME